MKVAAIAILISSVTALNQCVGYDPYSRYLSHHLLSSHLKTFDSIN
jgi:hypothetical protein